MQNMSKAIPRMHRQGQRYTQCIRSSDYLAAGWPYSSCCFLLVGVARGLSLRSGLASGLLFFISAELGFRNLSGTNPSLRIRAWALDHFHSSTLFARPGANRIAFNVFDDVSSETHLLQFGLRKS